MILYRLQCYCCHRDMSILFDVSYGFQFRLVVYIVVVLFFLLLEAVRDEREKKIMVIMMKEINCRVIFY